MAADTPLAAWVILSGTKKFFVRWTPCEDGFDEIFGADGEPRPH
jgi:hypothetical protein